MLKQQCSAASVPKTCSSCWQHGVEWKVLLLLCELRTPCPVGATEHLPPGPFQVKGRKWATFPGACWDFWVNSGHVDRLHDGASDLAEAFCISGTQTTNNFQFMSISVCIYLHSW